MDKWDKRFILLAEHIAQWSKDPSTKCGAVIVRPDKSIASVGFNGFPRGMKDDDELYANREVKYDRVIHCEINAILSANAPVKGCTLYVWPYLTCSRCAVHCIQAGIVRVVAPKVENERWNDAFERALGYYEEADVQVDLIDKADLSNRLAAEREHSTGCQCST